MRRRGIAAAWLAVLAAAASAGPEETADKLWSEFAGLRGDEGWKATDRRLDILRALGGCDCGKARQVLLQLARTSRSGDERVLATLSLGRIADLETARALLLSVERKPDPVVAQALADALAGSVKPDILAWLESEALGTKQPEVLRACLEALAAVEAPDAVPKLVEIYGGSKDVAVLHEAVRALGRAGGAGARPVVMAAASHPEWRVRLAAADVLPDLAKGDETLLAPTKALVLDPEARVRRAVAMAIGEAKLEALAPDLIDLLEKDSRLRTREAARQALKKIGGCDYGHDAAAWRQWWKMRGEDKQTLGEPDRKITFAQYYGVSVQSDRVLFVVDVSGSMSWPWRKEPRRIDVARKELSRVLKELRPESLFNVILFSTKVRAWQKSEVAADARHVEAALAWVDRNVRDPEGDTYAYDALEEAFERNPEFDTICLLSDGAPSHGPYASPEGILASVKVWNRYRGAVIHTIGLTLENMDRGRPNLAEDLRLMKDFVQRLASGTGGECKIILQPPP
jgi:HEAT repeat protein